MSLPDTPIYPNRFAIRSRRVVTPHGCNPHTIFVAGETIEAVLPHDTPTTRALTDLGDLVVLPGLVDTHVHINDPHAPPRSQWEGFDSATRAAAAGGITTLVDMPLNSTPVTTSVAALQQKRTAARDTIHVDVGFHGGLIHDNTKEIPPLLNAGVLGIKAFLVHSGIDDFPPATESDLRAVMPLLARKNTPLLAHAEIDDTPAGNLPNQDPRSYARYLASRPPHWETTAIDMLIRLAHEYHCPTHVVHLATELALPALLTARTAHTPITVETCPHYLFFAAEHIPDGATPFKCAPPIRGQQTRHALWNALSAGDIDMIASDHSPCPPALKQQHTGDFTRAWGGISSLQLTLPITWTAAKRFNPEVAFTHLAQWLSVFPAHLVRLSNKGAIAPGKDADFAIFDPDALFTVDPNALHHRHKLTPYAGQPLAGIVQQTYLRGRLIYDRGRFIAERTGRMLARRDVH